MLFYFDLLSNPFFAVTFSLFINYNTIINYILIIYELSNFDNVLSIVSQTKVSGGNGNDGPHPNSLAHYLPLAVH